ncbi:MAG: DUF2306 domain-containing protein [Chloroflexota bacterium]
MNSQIRHHRVSNFSIRKLFRTDWFIIGGLLFLCLVPTLAGAMRVAELASGAEVTTENARFFEAPFPILSHIISVTIYSIVGAFQFAPNFRRRHMRWHRQMGWVLAVSGIVAAWSGIWMTFYYSKPEGASFLLDMIRLFFGVLMLFSIFWAMVEIRRRDFKAHEAWMMRGYAIGLGAGTQVFTHLPWFIFFSSEPPGDLPGAIMMAGGWLINLLFVEWIIWKRPFHPTRSQSKQQQGIT